MVHTEFYQEIENAYQVARKFIEDREPLNTTEVGDVRAVLEGLSLLEGDHYITLAKDANTQLDVLVGDHAHDIKSPGAPGTLLHKLAISANERLADGEAAYTPDSAYVEAFITYSPKLHPVFKGIEEVLNKALMVVPRDYDRVDNEAA